MISQKEKAQLKRLLATIQSTNTLSHHSLTLLDKLLVKELVVLADVEGEDVEFGTLIPIAIRRLLAYARPLDRNLLIKYLQALTALYNKELEQFLSMPPRIAFSKMMKKERWKRAFASITAFYLKELIS
jgi:hypothetical protein